MGNKSLKLGDVICNHVVDCLVHVSTIATVCIWPPCLRWDQAACRAASEILALLVTDVNPAYATQWLESVTIWRWPVRNEFGPSSSSWKFPRD